MFPAAVFSEAIPVDLRHGAQGWQLVRNGQPYLIKGAGGAASLELLASAGGNSIRTWSADNLGATLERAQELGLTVTAGIWLGHERHGFDYDDAEQVRQQFERAREIVSRYKDHPALLIWAIGNEMEGFDDGDNPAIWKAVNDIAAMIKELDPAHPTMTVTAEIGGARIDYLHRRCPAIDIHGINSYGGAASLLERYRLAGSTKPFVLTEFGPPGPWEVAKTQWGAPLEPSSTEKAALYRAHYQRTVRDGDNLALGSYVFNWGFKMEGTATWFGMFLDEGAELGTVDAMTELWSGKPPVNLAPIVEPLVVERGAQVNPGARIRIRSHVSDPEGDALTVRWALRPESDDYTTGGDFRPPLADIDDAIVEASEDSALVRMPEYPGAYRLFYYAYDAAGKAATANVPLLVKGEVRTRLPVVVYEDGFEGMPWAPSGWMGAIDSLTLDGGYAENPHSGNASIRMRYTGEYGWAGIAWQNPPNNWGDEEGGYDLGGATQLTLWARGEYGGERIKIGVGIIGDDKAHPDSGIAAVDGIVLSQDWQRYSIPLKRTDLSSIKTGFVIVLNGRKTPVTVYLDRIRFAR
ncbi:MAG: glycoside hydrolase family 2 TIM barrel-domain containing protein [Woeseia sp.]